MLELVERKAEGEEITIQPAGRGADQGPDLMAALEASLAAVKDPGAGGISNGERADDPEAEREGQEGLPLAAKAGTKS